MQLRQEVLSDLDRIVGIISSHKADYEKVSAATGVPWYVIAAIHNLEASLNFTKHLHNGNPLTARTYEVPPGRPKTGSPPFAWPESAADALLEKVNGTWKSVPGWSIPALLWKTEMYNGAGYRTGKGKATMPPCRSPYLWGGTNHYQSGKYIADNKWSSSAVSQQRGIAAIIRRLIDKGVVNDAQLAAGGPAGVISPSYALGCADPGVAGQASIASGLNPTSNVSALEYALGLHIRDRMRSHELRVVLDVGAFPEILNLEAQKTFALEEVGKDLDSTDWVVDEMTVTFGETVEAYLVGTKPDPNAPTAQVFLHSQDGTVAPAPGTAQVAANAPVPATGDINERVYKAALAARGESSLRSGLGRPACAWCINNLVLPKAGIAIVGKANPNYVPTMVAEMQAGRATEIIPNSKALPGDIVTMGAEEHVGICTGPNKALSHGSTPKTFSWETTFEGYSRSYSGNRPCRVWRLKS
jgi:lysozyme family protein